MKFSLDLTGLTTLVLTACGDDVVSEYLQAAREAGFRYVRIIHGKGTGTMRRTVHAVLAKHKLVLQYAADPGRGGWGATVVELVPTTGA